MLRRFVFSLAALLPCAAAQSLTPAEFGYAVRDLIGVDAPVPSAARAEYYLTAAGRAAQLAVFGPKLHPPSVLARYQAPARVVPLQDTPLTEHDATGLSRPTALHVRHNFPAEAVYLFAPSVGGPQQPGIAMRLGLWVDGQPACALDTVAGKRIELRGRVPAGEHVVSITHLAPTIAQRINAVEIVGPFDVASGPSDESLRLVYTCGHLDGRHNDACARRIVGALAHRAFRRAPTAGELDRLLALVTLAQSKDDSFEAGIALAIEGILSSPSFLFRAANRNDSASRLSFFLWSSIPDDELLRAAEDGSLRRPEILDAQVHRMLKDAKASRLSETFAAQWLETRRLAAVRPDPDRFPIFDEHLRDSMRRETEFFFDHILRDDRSVFDFLDARYTFLNQRLAIFYGIPGVTGTAFREIELGATTRAGVLGQASVLTVSSYANRTSPVLRGKWILDSLLNAPPPPPPPDVPTLDESAAHSPSSMRQQLEQHRANPACAACHARMDPLGLPLEDFNAIGEWRADGSSDGPEQLRATLHAKRDRFARALTEKLLSYALARELRDPDRATVDRIVRRLAAGQYRFQTLLIEIAHVSCS